MNPPRHLDGHHKLIKWKFVIHGCKLLYQLRKMHTCTSLLQVSMGFLEWLRSCIVRIITRLPPSSGYLSMHALSIQFQVGYVVIMEVNMCVCNVRVCKYLFVSTCI